MKKRLLILLIASIVVLNISTNCGYGRMNRALAHPIVIDDDQVDSIRIKKPADKEWKRLDEEQESSFENICKEMEGCIPFRFKADYEIRVFLKSKHRRDFFVQENEIRERRLHYYGLYVAKDFFDKLYADAK
jgi:mRNA-degrading endonuclease RelE of RelBE toxin-antitoxin system